MNDEELRVYKAQTRAALEQDLKEARPSDPLHDARIAFIMELAQARRKKGLSQTQLAAHLGLQQSALARIESGRGNPSLNTLLKIAKVLGVNLVLKYNGK